MEFGAAHRLFLLQEHTLSKRVALPTSFVRCVDYHVAFVSVRVISRANFLCIVVVVAHWAHIR